MNILHIISSSNFGGAENYLYLLTKYQNKLGHNVFVYRNRLRKLDSLLENNVQKDIKTNIINSISPYHLIKLLLFVKKNNIDIIHTHLSKASILGGLLSKITDIKSYATIHGMNKFKDYYLTDYLIAVSEAVKRKLKNTGANKKNIKVIYNGIEKNSEKIKENFFQNKKLKLTYIGRLSSEKNLLFLINVLDKWSFENWNLKIIGEGKEKKNINERIKKIKLNDKIRLLGFKKNIEEYILNTDFIVLPSEKEGFGLSIIEGFSFGVPAIGSNTGGIKEIINHKQNGFLFKKNNKNSLIEMLNYIIDKREFFFWSKNAFQKYKNNFKIIDNAKEVLNYYEEK